MQEDMPGRDARPQNMKKEHSILVIDDEEGMRALLAHELGLQGYLVSTAADGQAALDEMARNRFDLVICDIRMPKVGGLDALGKIKELNPGTEVIIMTGYGSVETAVKAMKAGAYDFIQKPFEIAEISALVEKAVEKGTLRESLAMHEASRAVFSFINFDQLLPTLLRLLKGTLQAADAAVMLPGTGGKLEILAETGLEDEKSRLARLAMAGKGTEGTPFDGGNATISTDPDGTSVIMAHLAIDSDTTAVLIASRPAGASPFREQDSRGFVILAAQAVLGLRNAVLYRKLEAKVHELETARNELIQSEKLAAVGRLTTGIAHELNNPLGAIIGISELLLRDTSLAEPLKNDLTDIHSQTIRCKHIIQELMHFSRKTAPRRVPLDIGALLEETLQLLKNDLFRSGVKLNRSLPHDLAHVTGDPGQIKQVFVNLILNSLQAIEGAPSPELTIAAGNSGEKIAVELRDNGHGIPEKDLPHIFEPFFTTRPTGKGMGLGLSVSYGIVQSHGGEISARNLAGGGCAFKVELPALKKDA